MSATAAPYSTGGNTGITLYLNAVQVVELVSGDSNGQQNFGFVAQENGYQHSEEMEEAFNTEETTPTAEADDDDF